MNSFTRIALGISIVSFAFPLAAFAADPSVTVLVNGSSEEVTVADGSNVRVTWTSEKGRTCFIEYPGKKGETKKNIGNQGKASIRVYPSVKENTEVFVSCVNTKTGKEMFDSVSLELPPFATNETLFKLNAPSTVQIGQKYELTWEEGRIGSIYERLESFPSLKAMILLKHTNQNLGIGQTVVEKLSAQKFEKGTFMWKVGKKTNDGRPLPAGAYEMVMYLDNPSASKSNDGAIGQSEVVKVTVTQ